MADFAPDLLQMSATGAEQTIGGQIVLLIDQGHIWRVHDMHLLFYMNRGICPVCVVIKYMPLYLL